MEIHDFSFDHPEIKIVKGFISGCLFFFPFFRLAESAFCLLSLFYYFGYLHFLKAFINFFLSFRPLQAT